jgi:PAS domain S-box-containing protein
VHNDRYVTEVSAGAVVGLTDNLRISVLYVEDERLVSKVMKELLELQGRFVVDTAYSVQDAYERLKQGQYDVIVSDYLLPEKDGLQFLKELRESGNSIPFILFTGKGREEVAIKALNLGADQYVNKTGETETVYCELAHAIRQAVDRRSAQIESLKREGKLDAILESSPDAITVTDLDGNIVECNQAAVDMHGFESKEKLIGKNAFELIAKKDHKKAIQNLKKTLQLRSVKNVEYTCLTKDGREFQAELSASVVRDASGEPEYFMAITKDITERKKAEKTLQESEERFRAIFDGANDGILVADAKTKRFFFANPRICEITGYSLEELLKLGVDDIHPKKDLPHVIDSFTKQMQGKLTLSKDIPVLRKDERVVYCDVSARPMKIGSQEYLIGLFRDVTELKKAEEKINLLSSVVQQALEGIAVSDLDGKILFANSAWLKMHGFDEDEEKDLVGKQVGRFYCRQQVESLDRQVQSGGIFRGRVTQVRKDGTTFPALATLNPLRDENGRVIGIIRMAKILTEIVRDIRDTKSTNASCTEKNMTKGRGL